MPELSVTALTSLLLRRFPVDSLLQEYGPQLLLHLVRFSWAMVRNDTVREEDQMVLYLVSAPREEPPRLDIVFAHGLGGDARDTWVGPESHFWPERIGENLGFSSLRCLSYGYPAGQLALQNGAHFSVEQQGRFFAEALRAAGVGRDRKYIIIAHSLGGLVAKHAVLHALERDTEQGKPQYNGLHENLLGIVFFGTPHRGSRIAEAVLSVQRKLRLPFASRLVHELAREYDEGHLTKLDNRFRNFAERGGKRVLCFAEQRASRLVGEKIVDSSSASGAYPNDVISSPGDHFSMAKFAAKSDYLHNLASDLRQWVLSGHMDAVPETAPDGGNPSSKFPEKELPRIPAPRTDAEVHAELNQYLRGWPYVWRAWQLLLLAAVVLVSLGALGYRLFGSRQVQSIPHSIYSGAEVHAATLAMGTPPSEPGREPDEGPVTQVRFNHSFWIQDHEVTQGEWQSVMDFNPSMFVECGPDCPVDSISWWDAIAFCNRLSELTGYPSCYELYDCDGAPGAQGYLCESVTFRGLQCRGFRLPTEQEWEYACRAGTATATYEGGLTILGKNNAPELDVIAWYGGNSGVFYSGAVSCRSWPDAQHPADYCGTHPVRSKHPNAFGLYDMIGNVSEWMTDSYAPDLPGGGVVAGVLEGTEDPVRSVRGGGWDWDARYMRCGNRAEDRSALRLRNLGMRLARTIDRESDVR